MLVGAVAVVFMFGRCSGNDRAMEELNRHLERRIEDVRDSLDTVEARVEARTDTIRVIDSLYVEDDGERLQRAGEVTDSLERATSRFDSLTVALPAIRRAGRVPVELTLQLLDIERARVRDLETRIVQRDSLIAGLRDKVSLALAGWEEEERLRRSYQRAAGGNFSLLGWRIHVRCGLGFAVGADIRGQASAVGGLACSVSP